MNFSKLSYVLTIAMAATSALSGCSAFPSRESGDAEIESDVQALIDSRSDITPNSIHVQSIDHVVYLDGLVDTEAEKRNAESLASQVHGVTEVVNSIEQNSN